MNANALMAEPMCKRVIFSSLKLMKVIKIHVNFHFNRRANYQGKAFLEMQTYFENNHFTSPLNLLLKKLYIKGLIAVLMKKHFKQNL